MLNVAGAVQIFPARFSAEAGEFNNDGQRVPAVILIGESPNGTVHMIFPSENADAISDAIKKAKAQAASGIIVPNNPDAAMKQAKQSSEVEHEIRGSK